MTRSLDSVLNKRIPVPLSERIQIILRARQNYLVQRFRAETQTVSPELLETILLSWQSYVRSKVCKGLSPVDTPTEGQEWDNWTILTSKMQDATWKTECMRRDEKFDMHFTAAVSVHFTNNSLELT